MRIKLSLLNVSFQFPLALDRGKRLKPLIGVRS